ncbi:MAG: hypothetical protein Q7V88_07730 [Actinomycetota bacterium]|nr:hypothetical protein [Actinomycetota bacterium]
MYWESQWTRNSEFEDQRLQVTNFVVAASVVALGAMAVAAASERWMLVVVGISVLLANLMALSYSFRSAQWARVHKQRARLVLEENWPYFVGLQERAYEIKRGHGRETPRPHQANNLFRREMLQRGVHVLLGLLAVGLGIFAPLKDSDDGPLDPVTTTVPSQAPNETIEPSTGSTVGSGDAPTSTDQPPSSSAG